MKPQWVSSHSLLYETLMLGLYGFRGYTNRYQAIAERIPRGASVLELCCGPAMLYHRHLKAKQIQYTGLDIHESFIEALNRGGAQGLIWDVNSDTPLPEADFVLIQASLSCFLPDVTPVLRRMVAAARREVIIAEPIRSLPGRVLPILNWLQAKPSSVLGRFPLLPTSGYDEFLLNETLDDFWAAHAPNQRPYVFQRTANGLEMLYCLPVTL
jgi:hypothetical protein